MTPKATAESGHGAKFNVIIIIVAASMAALVAILSLSIGAFVCWRRKRSLQRTEEIEEGAEQQLLAQSLNRRPIIIYLSFNFN